MYKTFTEALLNHPGPGPACVSSYEDFPWELSHSFVATPTGIYVCASGPRSKVYVCIQPEQIGDVSKRLSPETREFFKIQVRQFNMPEAERAFKVAKESYLRKMMLCQDILEALNA